MSQKIEVPTIGEILKEEFMEPYGLSAYAVAKRTGVAVSRIQDILHNRRKMTADTPLRLARLFGVSDRYFLRLQGDIDIRNRRNEIADELDEIRPLAKK
jgi:addiction module HigA family antidote